MSPPAGGVAEGPAVQLPAVPAPAPLPVGPGIPPNLEGTSWFLTAYGPADKSTEDRKSTRLNSSHANISYAVFCLKKKKTKVSPTKRDTASYTYQTILHSRCLQHKIPSRILSSATITCISIGRSFDGSTKSFCF